MARRAGSSSASSSSRSRWASKMAASPSPAAPATTVRAARMSARAASRAASSARRSSAGSAAGASESVGSGARSRWAGPTATPGATGRPRSASPAAGASVGAAARGSGAAAVPDELAAGSSSSPKLSSASALIAASARAASGPLARTTISWPCLTPRVASAVSERALAGPRPVVALDTSTVASADAAAPTNRAAGRACSPSRLPTTTRSSSPSAAAAAGAGAAPSSPAPPPSSSSTFARSAPRASAATSSRPRPPRAAAAAATAPSTSGAAASTTRVSPGPISTAISALISALPRSMSTSTPASEATFSIASRTTIASVPIAPRGSAMPPAASIATPSPPISRASSTTPSASFAECETMTRPTVIASTPAGSRQGPRSSNDAQSRKAVGAVQHLDRMHGAHAGRLLDVPAAGLAVAHGEIRRGALDLAEQRRPDVHRDRVLLALEPVRAGDAAAARVVLDDPQAGNQRHEVERRLADPVALLLARRVVGDRHVDRLEVGVELAALVQLEQELDDVVGPPAHLLERRVALEAEDLARLALEHERAARRRADDDRAVGERARQPRREPADVRARVVEHPVGLQRQPAAVLLGHVDREAVVGEHRDRHLAQARLVVADAAAVEVDDPLLRRRRPVLARPRLEGAPGELRHRRVAVDAHRLLDEHPDRLVAQRPVGDRRGRRAEPAEDGRAGDEPLAQRDPVALAQARLRARVDLRDVDAVRADLRADPAARAVVERGVGHRLAGAEALGLRPDVLRPREQRRDVRERAVGLADRALHAVVERAAHRVEEHVVPCVLPHRVPSVVGGRPVGPHLISPLP